LHVINQTGSVASYFTVQPSLLRVGTHEKHGSFPSTWPMLTDVLNDDIATFD
jgi:hypothetical protein